jgi:ribosomal subunit interface protein
MKPEEAQKGRYMTMIAENNTYKLPLEITFRDFESSDAVTEAVEQKLQKLMKFYDRIERCHVTLSAPHRHHSKGKQYHIHIDLHVPGKNVIVSHDPKDDKSHEDFYVSLRDAFATAERQLKAHVRKMKDHKAFDATRCSLNPPQD